MTDWQLLQQYARDGNRDALDTLVRRYADLVYSACRRQIRDSHLSEDAAQAVFFVLARKAKRIRRGTPLSGWLVKTARYTSLQALRTEARRRKHEKQAGTMHANAPDDEAHWRDLEPHLDAALATLKPLDRSAVVLRYFQQKKLAEVADELNISPAAAEKRVSRAVGKLHKLLQRRGVALSAGALTALVTTHAVHAAPVVISTSGAAIAAGGAGITAIVPLAEGVTKMMMLAKMKTVAASVVVATAVATTAVIGATKLDLHGDPMPEHAVARLGTTRLHHDYGMIRQMDVARNKRNVVVTSADDRTVRVWDLKDGKQIRQFGLIPRIGQAVAISADANTVAVMTHNGKGAKKGGATLLIVYDVASGKELHRIEGHYVPGTNTIGFSPDGKEVIFASAISKGLNSINYITCVNLKTGTTREFRKLNTLLAWLGYSADGKHILMVPSRGTDVKAVDSQTGKTVWEIQASQNVQDIALSSDGDLLATMGGKGQVELWELDEQKKLRTWDISHPGRSVAFSSDAKMLVATSEGFDRNLNRSLLIWNTQNGKKLVEITPNLRCRQVAFTRDDSKLAVVGESAAIELYDTTTWQHHSTAIGHISSLASLAVSADGKLLATGDAEGLVCLWQADSGKLLGRIPIGNSYIMALGFHPDGKQLAVATAAELAVWSVGDHKKLSSAPLPGGPKWRTRPEDLAYTSDGNQVRLLLQSGVLCAWKPGARSELEVWLSADGSPSRHPALSSNGRFAASIEERKNVTIWSVDRKKAAHTFVPKVKQILRTALSTNGDYLVGTGNDGRVFVWNVETRTLVGSFDPDWKRRGAKVHSAAISSNGQLLGLSSGREALVVDPLNGKTLMTLDGEASPPVSTLVFTPDARHMITAQSDGTALVWDLAPAWKATSGDKEPLTTETLAKLYETLGDKDGPGAERAMRRLSSGGQGSLQFLLGKVETFFADEKLDQNIRKQISELTPQLGSEDYQKRQAATKELQKLMNSCAPLARTAMIDALRQAAKTADVETKSRLNHLLTSLAEAPWSSSARRGTYLVLALQRLGGEEARGALSRLAKSAGNDRIRRRAQRILQEMKD